MADITEYNLPKNTYASFDARNLRDLIIERLNENSNVSFTDQNFEGSNLNAIIDIISYSFHTLLFYLNQTSSEAIYTETQLYENINRIVKTIGYNPVGKQTSIAPMNLTASGALNAGYYTIPRFAYTTSNGKIYTSGTKNITVYKPTTGVSELLTVVDNNLFYEGQVIEYPLIDAVGEEFETISLLPGENVIVDHFNISIFVKEKEDGKWYEYKRTPSLYLNTIDERVYECRLNHNKNYEITFGNNINGRQLQLSESVAIYYVSSTGTEGQISANTFNNASINIYNSTQYDQIFEDTKSNSLTYFSIADIVNITASNPSASTYYDQEETVEEIKRNAPNTFSSEYKLTSKTDYETYINKNFKNIIFDCKVSNNSDYLNNFRKYITEDLKLNSILDYNNALYNQFNYSDSFDVNNIFVTIVPKFKKNNSVVTRSNYISTSLKNEILNDVRQYKLLNSEITFLDPVYMEVDLLLKQASDANTVRYRDYTQLVIVKSANSIISNSTIVDKVYNILESNINNTLLGNTIDVNKINTEILNTEGVSNMYTKRIDTNVTHSGISLGVYNPIYNGRDLKTINSNSKMYYFQVPYLRDKENIINKIVVVSNTSSQTIDY